MSLIATVLILGIAFFINYIYHKLFHVVYVGCMPIVCEWLACLLASAVIVSILLSSVTM